MGQADRVAVVTGGSRGIGRAICERLAEDGARVVVGFRADEEGAEATVKRIADAGGPAAAACRFDVADYDAVSDALGGIARTHRGIDVLVNNAAVGDASAVVPMNPVSDWTGPVHTNLFGTLHCVKAVSLHMLVRGRGAIVNIASIAGVTGIAGLSSYCASKAGVIGMTKALSREFAPHGVRINAVAPGYTAETGMVDRIEAHQLRAITDRIAMERLADPREIANAVAFLASDEAGYITGHTLVVDGGLTA
ncbi:3-oxoacyl-[acyl-carrier-protein] reductase [Murinocardiopsis flavida]|uniref:3-oxoacyl-[acyl-carrier-protein] reductase n=1 Tax=Murinocardiopsis flavida TaxID=645275 RepID=A0A2P8D563_9ACTN|nr:3-oxoacyl-ACP reductase FabG [Murinocardiopsis flavida]PSK92350.1 3-oxoacyl-[acyl-carrier-protein] reductase [Murinocardiopsis flavida]